MTRPVRLASVIALLALLALLPAATVHAQLVDMVGVYFDESYTVYDTVNEDTPHLATAYLVLHNPSQTVGGLGGWECRVEFEGYSPLVQWHLNGPAVNYQDVPDFIVGMTDPLPITGPNVLLATFDMMIAEPIPFQIELVPLRHAPSIPDAMAYIPFDDKEQLTPMSTWTGGDVVASYNWLPYCDVDRSILQYGEHPVGLGAVQSVTVTNLGGGTLVVDPTIVGADAFQIVNQDLPAYLGTNESVEIDIEFTANALGLAQATLDLGVECSDVTLYGYGRAAITSYYLDPTSLDFGSVIAGGTFSAYVRFVNNGETPIAVTPSITGCPEFRVSPDTYMVVDPFRSRLITVYFEPPAIGPYSCELSLGSGLDTVPIQGLARDPGEVLYLSAQELDFGDLLPGQSSYMDVDLFNVADEPVTVVPTIPGSTPFRLVYPVEGSQVTVSAHSSRNFRLAYDPLVVGTHADVLTFASVGLSTNLLGRCLAPPDYVEVAPPSIDFGTQLIGMMRERTVVVTNYTTATIDLVPEMDPDGPNFFILGGGDAGTLDPSASRTITVGFRPVSEGTLTATLNLGPDAPAVPLSGRGDAGTSTSVRVEPPFLDFGLWPVGSDVELELRVINTGSAAIDMDVFLDPAGPPFVLSAGGSLGIVAPHSVGIVRVRFQPTSPGDWTVSLNLGAGSLPSPVQVTGSADFDVPVCGLSSTHLEFPPTPTGGGTSMDLTLTNTGTATIDLDPSVNCSAFTVLGAPDELPAGESATMAVIFAPDIVGNQICYLDLGDGVCQQVILEGEGFIGVPVGSDGDLVGVYFDEDYTQPWIFDVGDGGIIEAYLVLKNPTEPEDISGFECRLLEADDLLLAAAELPAGGINLTQPPEFVVGLGVPQPATENVLLATLTYVAVGVPNNSPIALVPLRNPSIPNAMALAYGPEHALRPMYADSGQPVVAWVNYWDPTVGNEDPVEEDELPDADIMTTRLLPNVPNPFNPETAIRYEVAKEGRVRIMVYDVMGRRVASLLDEVRGVGADQVVWQGRDDNGRSLPSGAYYVRMEVTGNIDTRKVMLLK